MTSAHVEHCPGRIQRRRTKGWRKPADAVIVDRTSIWGNPFKVGADGDAATCVHNYEHHYLAQKPSLLARLPELAGKHLICFCPLDAPCHADVLLRWANR